MKPEETYLQHLRMIERIAAFVAHRHHLGPSEAEEFVQEARVRLIEDDYAVFRKFEGRSSISTYLTTVIGRLFNQWRVEQWGKWRPSAEAKRLGPKAITVEKLLTRDGFTWPEVQRMLTTGKMPFTLPELQAIYARLPNRTPRPVEVPEEQVPDIVAVESDAYTRLEADDRHKTLHEAMRKADAYIEKTLDAEDRTILKMRFWDARTIPEIASVLSLDPKKLYKRLDRLFGVLRIELVNAGVQQSDIAALLRDGDEDLHLHVDPKPENDPPRPSHERGGNQQVRGGEEKP